MLTENQERLLRRKICQMVEESLMENKSRYKHHAKVGDKDTGKSQHVGNKRRAVAKMLKDPKINNAELARELWPEKDQDTARSEFAERKIGHDADGKEYEFDDKEIIKLYNDLTSIV